MNWAMLKKQGQARVAAIISIISLLLLILLGAGIQKLHEMPCRGRGMMIPPPIATFIYNGVGYQLYHVKIDGHEFVRALVKPGRMQSGFIDPEHPNEPTIWLPVNPRHLEPVLRSDLEDKLCDLRYTVEYNETDEHRLY
jgi:hypothetical protein